MADIENNTGESPPLSQSAHSGADEYALPSKVRPEPSQSLNQQPNQSKTGNDSAEGVQDHHPSVERALEALTAAKITVVEYGAQPLYRFGSQEPLVLVEWLIPDESLIFASQILLEHDFPHILFPTEHGLWDRVQGALTHAVEGTELTRIQLVPLSLSGLKLSETIEVPSTFAPELRILSPKPPPIHAFPD
ncbi:hypothetical protein N7468_005271 [Penicillium chermesinum]|uniref:Uncharacterized protein n=1 Tax=Penicillium chermesinum TaxID=63820 RepID=A0A9W9TMU6_9EURO|nr:uncharacterized protein N7468_005271 [Penicillium chermesinum]KAJ5232315.1 hypothetical protein N7468_005271 [Penicillium chermesinum]